MAFAGQTVDEITSTLLGYWQTEYAAATPPRTLLVSRGSDAWMWARGLAYILQGLDAQAAQNARDILPDQASDEAVARFGNVYGVPRRPGVGAQFTVVVTGAPSTTFAVPVGSALAWTDGTLYSPLAPSVTTDVSGNANLDVEATTTGASTTRDAGDVLTWQSAPAGLSPTATVSTSITTGADVESIGDWAQRIIGRLRERPGSGNRSDWKAWVEAFTGLDIRDVWVYPRIRPPASAPGLGEPETLGCVTIVVAGPSQGDRPDNTRVLGGTAGGTLGTVKAYINGLVDSSGLVVTDGVQLRPVAMADADWTVEAIAETSPVNVQVTLVTNTANRFSFSGFSPAIHASSTRTSLVATGDYASGTTDLTNLAVLVNVGTAVYRGGYYRVVLPQGTYDGGTGRTTWDLTATPFPVGATPSGTIYGCPGCWGALRLAAFSYFDALGAGTATSSIDATPVERFPTEDAGARATLYRDALRGLLAGAPGVLSANVTSPGADVTPNQKTVVVLGTFLAVGS